MKTTFLKKDSVYSIYLLPNNLNRLNKVQINNRYNNCNKRYSQNKRNINKYERGTIFFIAPSFYKLITHSQIQIPNN